VRPRPSRLPDPWGEPYGPALLRSRNLSPLCAFVRVGPDSGIDPESEMASDPRGDDRIRTGDPLRAKQVLSR